MRLLAFLYIFFSSMRLYASDMNETPKYNLRHLVDFGKLFDTNPQHTKEDGQMKAEVIFSDFMYERLAQPIIKKFIPSIKNENWRTVIFRPSNNFDRAHLKSWGLTIITGSGEKTEITPSISYSIKSCAFSNDATKLFASTFENHFVVAEKVEGIWVENIKDFKERHLEKRGYYLHEGKIENVLEELSKDELRKRLDAQYSSCPFYLGQIENNSLIITDEDQERNYLYAQHCLISPNKSYVAFYKDFHINVFRLNIIKDTLTLDLLYKVATVSRETMFNAALTDQASLLFYDGEEALCDGFFNFTQEHYFFQMLTNWLKPERNDFTDVTFLLLASITHILVDGNLIKPDVLEELNSHPLGAKVIVLKNLERLYEELRYVVKPMAFFDFDYETRRKMYREAKENSYEAETLLQRVALQFFGRYHAGLNSKINVILLDETKVKQFERLFDHSTLERIFNNYSLTSYITPNF